MCRRVNDSIGRLHKLLLELDYSLDLFSRGFEVRTQLAVVEL